MKSEDVTIVQIRDYFDMTNKEIRETWLDFTKEEQFEIREEVAKELEKKKV